jgi:hypothetical protein
MNHISRNLLKVLILFVSVLGAASNGHARSNAIWAKLNGVRYVHSETKRDHALEKAILISIPGYSDEIRQIQRYDPNLVPTSFIRYFYNRVDLNDDGQQEVLVWLHGLTVGGSSGYTTQIYRRVRNDYFLLWESEQTWNPIIVSTRRTRGWRNLIMLVAGGGVRPGFWTEVRFNGAEYPADPRERISVKKSRISGRAFIADDWWTGFKGIELRPNRGSSRSVRERSMKLREITRKVCFSGVHPDES